MRLAEEGFLEQTQLDADRCAYNSAEIALAQSGRRTAAFLELSDFSGNLEIFVASAADALYASPANSGLLLGLAATAFNIAPAWSVPRPLPP